jgi:putative phage-type endonuclease
MMMNQFHFSVEQRTPEWMAARKGRLTGSNIGAALGLNPWRSPEDLIRAMVREYHGAPSEFTGNVATEYGTFHEAGAIAEFTMLTGIAVEPCGFFTYANWLGGSPDGLISEDALLEVKCPYGQREANPPTFKTLADQPHYYAQVQINLLCTERSTAYFWQWSPFGHALETVQRDDGWLVEHIPKLYGFWQRVQSELDNPDHLKDRRIDLATIEAHKLTEEYDQLGEAIDRATDRRKEILAELVAMARNQDADIFGRKLTRVERAGSVGYAKVVKDHLPDLDLSPYTGKPTQYWRLT